MIKIVTEGSIKVIPSRKRNTRNIDLEDMKS